jgi:hypothetical protein
VKTVCEKLGTFHEGVTMKRMITFSNKTFLGNRLPKVRDASERYVKRMGLLFVSKNNVDNVREWIDVNY